MKDGYTAYPLRATAHLMPFDSYQPGSWLLTSIEVAVKDWDGTPLRGKGVARRLMEQVLADADAEGVVLCLSIEPDGTGLDEDQLRSWYERLGFVNDPDLQSDIAMIRQPAATIGDTMRVWSNEDISDKQTDYATFLRIPLLTSAHPTWDYITGVVVDHWATLTPEDEGYAMMPTDAELDQIAEWLREYNTWYSVGEVNKMREFAPYDIDGGANCGYLRKRGEDDWVYRKKTWNRGPTWMPLPENPVPLAEVLVRAHPRWSFNCDGAAAK